MYLTQVCPVVGVQKGSQGGGSCPRMLVLCPERAYLSGGHERVLDAGLPRGGRTEGVARRVPVRARLHNVLDGRTCPEVISVYLTQVCPVVGVQKGSHGGFLSAHACTMS